MCKVSTFCDYFVILSGTSLRQVNAFAQGIQDNLNRDKIKSLSKELLEILLEYYIKGDGHIYGRTKKGLSATTTSIRLRDDLQEIALKIGISAYYKLGYKKGKIFISPGCKKLYFV